MGIEYCEKTIPEVIKVIFRLKNLRRAEGVAGRLAGFTTETYGTESPVYIDDTGNITYWPGSMTLVVSSKCFAMLLHIKLMFLLLSMMSKTSPSACIVVYRCFIVLWSVWFSVRTVTYVYLCP